MSIKYAAFMVQIHGLNVYEMSALEQLRQSIEDDVRARLKQSWVQFRDDPSDLEVTLEEHAGEPGP